MSSVSAPPLLVDVGAGTGGWQEPFEDAGWRTVGIDIRQTPGADVIGDVRQLPIGECHPTVLAMSPPCTQFARWMMPWLDEPNPDLELVHACLDAVDQLQPEFWILENSRGLHQYWRPARTHFGAFYLWGEFPLFSVPVTWDGKMQASGENPEARAAIPYDLADGLRRAVEVYL